METKVIIVDMSPAVAAFIDDADEDELPEVFLKVEFYDAHIFHVFARVAGDDFF